MNNNGDDDEYTIEGKFFIFLISSRRSTTCDGGDLRKRKGTEGACSCNEFALRALKRYGSSYRGTILAAGNFIARIG